MYLAQGTEDHEARVINDHSADFTEFVGIGDAYYSLAVIILYRKYQL